MIMESTDQEGIQIVNFYAPDNRTPKNKRQKLAELKRKIAKCTIIIGKFNTLLSVIERTSRQSISINNS